MWWNSGGVADTVTTQQPAAANCSAAHFPTLHHLWGLIVIFETLHVTDMVRLCASTFFMDRYMLAMEQGIVPQLPPVAATSIMHHWRSLGPILKWHVAYSHTAFQVYIYKSHCIAVCIDNLWLCATQPMYHPRVVQFITANHEPFFILFKNMLAISIRISSTKYAWHSGKRLQSSDCTVLVGTPPGPPVCNARVTGFISAD